MRDLDRSALGQHGDELSEQHRDLGLYAGVSQEATTRTMLSVQLCNGFPGTAVNGLANKSVSSGIHGCILKLMPPYMKTRTHTPTRVTLQD